MMCLIDSEECPQQRLKAFVPGLNILMKERPRDVDLERAVNLAGYAGDRSSVPLLVPLLDDKKVHSYSASEGGKYIPNSIAGYAHEALVKITGRKDVPPNRKAWEKVK